MTEYRSPCHSPAGWIPVPSKRLVTSLFCKGWAYTEGLWPVPKDAPQRGDKATLRQNKAVALCRQMPGGLEGAAMVSPEGIPLLGGGNGVVSFLGPALQPVELPGCPQLQGRRPPQHQC